MSPILSKMVRRLRQALGLLKDGQIRQNFSLDSQLSVSLKGMAREQRRNPDAVLDDVIRVGLNQVQRAEGLAALWDLLTRREQEVAALVCLGHSILDISNILCISENTVRTHTKNVYYKFGMSRKELQMALRDWDFRTWWEEQHEGDAK